jgi:hypothetical protein
MMKRSTGSDLSDAMSGSSCQADCFRGLETPLHAFCQRYFSFLFVFPQFRGSMA